MREKRLIKNFVMTLKTITQTMNRLSEMTIYMKAKKQFTNELYSKHDNIFQSFANVFNVFEIKYDINLISVSIDIEND